MDSTLPAEKADLRRRELLETFLSLIDYAKANGVHAVLIAGDLFDNVRVSATTQDVVYMAMKEASDVDFLILPGNHDAVSAATLGHHLSENVKIFGNAWESVRYGKVAISACAPAPEHCATFYQGLNLDKELTNIVMLHGQLGTLPAPDMIDATQLRGRGIDYLALGHIHSYGQQKLDAHGVAVYSGCLEGRGFDECGEKGFVELTWENGVLSWEFVPFAHRRFYSVGVDVSNIDNVSNMLACACEEARAQEIPASALVRFELLGSYSVDANKDIAYLESRLNQDFFFAKVIDKTTLDLGEVDFTYDQSLRGAFVRTVLASDESEEEKQRIIQCGLRALRGEDVSL